MPAKENITFHYQTPDRIPPDILLQIRELIERGEAVGTSYVEENLNDAFLVAYALDDEMRVLGTVTHKYPKEIYRRGLEQATGLSLSGYLERGYTAVDTAHRRRDIADVLIKGLIERSKGQKIYTTIRMDNIPALRLTRKNRMTLAATYINQRTGNEIGVFVNTRE
jgi:GNAT superfamily N-acetyltransferase